MSWYTTYRPATISQLHLPEVRERLWGLFAAKSFPHAILLTGPRGSGKTSSARIIANILNEPKNETIVKSVFFGDGEIKKISWAEPDVTSSDSQSVIQGRSMLVRELDAASNRGIDDVRLLREQVQVRPPMGLIQVVILDEVHMFTNEAFNALLKLLEEPPTHAVFVLATTEREKIPPTILSRCFEINYRSATAQELADVLKNIADQEKIEYEPEALTIIAQQADGSFRDAIKTAEQINALSGGLKKDQVANVVQLGLSQEIGELITAIVDGQVPAVTKIFAAWREKGITSKFFAKRFFNYLHQQFISHIGDQAQLPKWHFLLDQFGAIDFSIELPISLLHFELKSVEIALRSAKKKSGQGTKTVTAPVKTASKPISNPSGPDLHAVSDLSELEVESPKMTADHESKSNLPITTSTVLDGISPMVTPEINQEMSGNALLLKSRWNEFVTKVGEKNMAVELLLRSARPTEAIGHILKVAVNFPFHKDQLSTHKFMALLVNEAESFAEGIVELKFEVKTGATDQIDGNVVPVIDSGLEALAKEVLS